MSEELNTTTEVEMSTDSVIDSPVCSTDNVWVEQNMEKSLTTELNEIKTSINGKASSLHTHSGYIRTMNVSRTLTNSNGTFVIDTTIPGLIDGVYLVSFNYLTSSNALYDKSLYIMYYDGSTTLVPTYCVVQSVHAYDNPMIANINGNVRIATDYNSSEVTGCQVRIL